MKKKLAVLLRACVFVWKKSPAGMTLVAFISLIDGLLPAFSFILLQKLVDAVIGGGAGAGAGKSPSVVGLGVAWILVMIVQYTISTVITYVLEVTRGRCTKDLSMEILIKSAGIQGLAHFESKEFLDTTDWLSFTDRSVGPFLYQLNDLIKYFSGFLSLFALFASFELWVSAALTLSIVPSILIAKKRANEKSSREKALEDLSRRAWYYRHTVLTSEAAKEMRLFSFSALFKKKASGVFKEIENLNLRFQRFSAGGEILGTSIRVIAAGLIFLFMLSSARDGLLSAGSFAMLLQSLFQFSLNLLMLALVWTYMQGSYDYFAKFFTFLDIDDTIDLSRSKRILVEPVDTIRFDAVSFRYPVGTEVLRRVSFTLNAGDTVALVGENGAGKSTIVKLLMRLYDPCEGAIYLNGIDIREYDIASYRDKISGIFQDYMKYDLTLLENIYADEASKHDDLGGLPDILSPEDIGKLPEGGRTLLGTDFGGVGLSGGQWQRVALLRGLVKPHEVLLVDEPTAAIDPIEESRVFEMLFSHTSRITLFVTHRLGSIRKASKIIVLKQGSVIGDGGHDELMAHNDYYARLYSAQADMYKAEGGEEAPSAETL